MSTLLIDGDVYLHRHVSACTTEVTWNDDVETTKVDHGAAYSGIDSDFTALIRELGARRVIVALSASGKYWRHDIYPLYKNNRKGRKPPGWLRLKEKLVVGYRCVEYPFLEGDDVLGILATGTGIRGRKVVVSTDKDLRTIPGLHFNPHHPEEGVVEVSVDEADRFHLAQTLMGDFTDGYPGCPGIGPKSCEKWLPELGEEWSVARGWAGVLGAYENAVEKGRLVLAEGETIYDVAITQARLARILRAGEYTEASGVSLWSPPTTRD